MKLWDSVSTCVVILLCAVRAAPPTRAPQHSAAAGRTPEPGPPELPLPPPRAPSPSSADAEDRGETPGVTHAAEEPLPSDFEALVDFIKVAISRIRRSSESTVSSSTSSPSSSSRHRRERKRGASQRGSREGGGRGGGPTGRRLRGGGGGRGQGCALKQIQLNVTDLGLGYRSSEEMIFSYCSGPCRKSETNYDKILYNLAHNRRFPPKDTPPQACCRPIAFDDDLSFLDDDLVYHTVKKHSARKCGCV